MNLKLTNGTTIHYKKTGLGPVMILCIPGGPCFSHEYLDAFHHTFAEDQYTVVSYDPTGTGESLSVPFYHSFEQYAEELRLIVETLGFDDIYIIGHSAGTCVLFEYLLGANAKPKGVVMINPILDGTEFNVSLKQFANQLPKEFQDKREEVLVSGDMEAYVGLLSQYWFPNRFCRKDPWPQALITGLSGVSMEMVSYFLGPDPLNLTGAVLKWRRKNDIDQIDIPCLAIGGIHDYTPKDHIECMKTQMPNCKVLIAPNSSHTPWIEEEELVFKEIKTFIN